MKSSKQQQILSFWRDVEIFNLPDLDKKVFTLEASSPLPWPSSPHSDVKKVWRYTLYFGSIPKAKVIEQIEKNLEQPAKPQDWEEPVTGNTCLAILMLDENGRPDEKSYVQASYIHGLDLLISKQPMSEVPAKLEQAQEDFELRYLIPEQGQSMDHPEQSNRKGIHVSWSDLHKECQYLTKTCSDWYTGPVHVFYTRVAVSPGSVPDVGFLNSFYLDDLTKLFTQKAFGKGLNAYLSIDVPNSKRKDLIADKKELIKYIDPALLPLGRWPSNIANGLYTAQAGAVNSVLSALKNDAGLRGINGPPGTGKTTLLLDIIADVIVSRAVKILQTKDPLFKKDHVKIQWEKDFSIYYNLNTSVFDEQGIVVASSNNTAVKNITEELPTLGKLDTKAFPKADYFAEYFQYIIKDSWGSLSAALGNSDNKYAFTLNFWPYDKGFRKFLQDQYKPEGVDLTPNKQAFEKAKNELNSLLADFEAFQKEAAHFHNQLFPHICNKEQKRVITDQLEKVNIILHDWTEKLMPLVTAGHALEADIRNIYSLLDIENKHRPYFFFFHKLFNTVAFKRWDEPVQVHLSKLRELVKQQLENAEKLKYARSRITETERHISELNAELGMLDKEILQYQSLKNSLRSTYEIEDSNLVDDVFFDLTLSEMHLRNPYASLKINRLRSAILLQSLEVHKYAILVHAKQFSNNLNLFFSMLSGRAKVSPEITATLWGTFFFCVPVVSTTLASVSRLFPSYGQERIGWLLLDEAGQATPQSAAGIIWRSKRAIIVGDPLQIEPVITIPNSLVHKLAQQNEINATWYPTGTSVQVLADRISEMGTYMVSGTGEDKIWTGFPLRTHRRCDNPMFDIANKIAYSNQMVKATRDTNEEDFIGPSSWFHVSGNQVMNKQVIVEEIELLQHKIALLMATYQGEIFVISPFKSVGIACGERFSKSPNVKCGTIHTFQGKEAKVVFLVLGSDPASPASRQWASQKPNMLNVALTRAQKRFYVIGNKTLWVQCQFFDEMAIRL